MLKIYKLWAIMVSILFMLEGEGSFKNIDYGKGRHVSILFMLEGEGSLLTKSYFYEDKVSILFMLEGEGSFKYDLDLNAEFVLILFMLEGEGSSIFIMQEKKQDVSQSCLCWRVRDHLVYLCLPSCCVSILFMLEGEGSINKYKHNYEKSLNPVYAGG